MYDLCCGRLDPEAPTAWVLIGTLAHESATAKKTTFRGVHDPSGVVDDHLVSNDDHASVPDRYCYCVDASSA